VKGAGFSNRPINYSAIDEQAISSDNYYRLNVIDKDARSKYSSVIQVSCLSNPKSTSLVSVYPNPSNGVFKVNNAADGATMLLYNLKGEIVGNKILSEGENDFDFMYLDAGEYIVSIRNEMHVTTTKLIIQK